MDNSTELVKELMEEMSSSSSTQSKRVLGTKFGSSPYDVLCAGVRVLPDHKVTGSGGKSFTLVFDRSESVSLSVSMYWEML